MDNNQKSRLIKQIAEHMGGRGVDSKKVAARTEHLYKQPHWLLRVLLERELAKKL